MIRFYSIRVAGLSAALCLFAMLGAVFDTAFAQRSPEQGFSRKNIGGGDGGGRKRGGYDGGGRGGGSNAGGLILKLAPGIIGNLTNGGDDDDDQPRRTKPPRKKVTVDRDDDDDNKPRRPKPSRKKVTVDRDDDDADEPAPEKKRKVTRTPKTDKPGKPPVRVTNVPTVPAGPDRVAPPPGLAAGPPPFPQLRASSIADRPDFRADEIVVMVRDAPQPDAIAAQLAQGFNLVLQETMSFALLGTSRVYRFSIPDNRPVEPIVAAMAGVPGVGFAVPNSYYWLQGGPGIQPELQYALPKLRVADAQAVASGRGMTVAVIDSGVDAGHPAFKNANLTVIDVTDRGIAGADPHGTAITGIIAASGGDSLRGIAPDAKIVAIRAFAAEQLGGPPMTTATTLARAVDTAFNRGARIFNMSFAGRREPLLIELIDAAYAQGAVFVAAAGNDGPDAPPAYPAAHDKVIAITATDQSDALYDRANRGGYVLAAAPGVDILAAVSGHGLDYLSGTSFAAAHVTGIIALMKERNPQMTPEAVRQKLIETAHDLGQSGPDSDFGAGLTDAYGALMTVTVGTQN